MDEPACTAGSAISPIPARGPEDNRRRSLHVLESFTAMRLSTPESCTKAPASCVASTRLGALMNVTPETSESRVVTSGA
jgi:hypothetical protein